MRFNKIIVYTIFLFLGYGFIQFVPTGGLSIPIPVVYETTEILWFNLSLPTFLDMVFAPIITIVFFYYIHKAIQRYPEAEDSKPSQRQKDIMKVVFYCAALTLVAGILLHATMNFLNGLISGDISSDPLYIAIYYFDELLGHKLVHIGIYGFLIGLMVVQFWHRGDPELSYYDKVGIYLWPTAIGGVYAITVIEGQAGFDFWILSLVLIGVIVYYIKFKGLKLRENLFIHIVLVLSIAFVISTIVYAGITGLKPGYPFFFQPSEL